MRILVVEDDPHSREMLAAVLRKDGHTVVCASDGEEALNILRQPDSPRLVIMDWIMPRMDGVEVVRALRAVPTEEPPYVLMLTARDTKPDLVTALNAGANDYLCKPFDLAELRARLGVGQRMVEMQHELVESKRRLAHLATHDPLTGVLNRRAILERISGELARASRHGLAVAVAMADLDSFKRLNDTHGHHVGDAILVGVTDLMRNTLREYDLLGRYGGDELLLAAQVSQPGDVLPLFERVRGAVARSPIPTDAGPLSVTISIGCLVCRGSLPLDQVLRRTDALLYEAKGAGGNTVRWASEDEG